MNKTNMTYEISDDTKLLTEGPDWLKEKRQVSKSEFNGQSLPRRSLHLWRYTDPARLLSLTERAPVAGSSTVVDTIKQNGVTILPLAEAVATQADLVKKYLYSQVNESTGKFEAMNGALWSDGIFVHIAANTHVENLIHLVHVAPMGGDQVYRRVLIVAEPGSKATIIDEYSGGSSDKGNVSGSNSVVEIIALQESEIKYINFQNHKPATQSFLTHRASLAGGARMETIMLPLGGKLSKQNFGVRLDGPGADSQMYGFTLGTDRQHMDNHTKHHHRHGDTTSDIQFKVVLKDRAESAYTGLIRIDQSAANCQAYQINRNLMLSEGAKAETIPELEILNEEVSCSHGATMGEIDPEEIFYLTARGLDRKQAIQMIVAGFTASIFDRLPEALREQVSKIVSSRLENI